MPPAEDSQSLQNNAEFAANLDSAIASSSEVVVAPVVQDVATDSTTTVDVTQTPVVPWHKQVGLPGFDSLDESTAISRIQQIAQAGGQAYQQAQYLAQQLQQSQAQLEALRGQQQPPPPAKQAEPPKVPWEPIQLDESYLDYIDPATGQWRENTPHQVVIGYQKQQRALRDFQAKLYSKPHEVLAPLIEERAKSLVTPLEEQFQALQQQLQEQAQRQQIQSLLAPHQKQFYAVDQNGQPQVDQFGNPVLTQMGQAFNGYTAAAMQMGITDPRIVAAVGALAAQRDELQRQLASVQSGTPAPTQRQQHDQNIYPSGRKQGGSNGVNRMANRGNTVSVAAGDPKVLANERVTLESAAAAKLRELGFN